ncbi:MAG: ribbon-helix-helix protein, CopG family [Caldisericia bacterium]|nr:ribbon-helix-helix protein, CopG family [Caldisericia bacterium]
MITVRLPKELEERLNKLAIEEERPKSYIIRKALEEYLADYEDSHNVMSFLKDNQKIYPNKKIEKRLVSESSINTEMIQ